MSDADARFRTALDEVEQLPERPGNDDMLRLYALYKQATVGDVTGDRPGMMDFVGRAKYDAWAGMVGTPADDAKDQYADLVDRLKASAQH